MRMKPSFQPSTISVQQGGRGRGFTLLELLVATTITAVLAGFIVILVSNVAAVWTRTSNRLTADAQARYVLDQLALDLSSAQFRDDGNVWFAVDVLDATNNTSLWQRAGTANNAKPAGGLSLDVTATRADLAVKGAFADTRYGNAGVWLRFFTTRRGANDSTNATTSLATASVPVAVSYQIVRRFTATTATGVAATNTAYVLHRVEARPAINAAGRPGVLESGYDLTKPAYTTGTANNTGNTTGDPRTIRVVTTTPRNLDSVIAQNVIDFGVRCYVRDAQQPDGLRITFPALVAVGVNNLVTLKVGYSALSTHPTQLRSSLPASIPVSATNFDQFMPDVVDVMVRILTDEGARLIALYEQTNSPLTLPPGVNAQQYWWQIAMSHSQVFTRRIVINAHSL